ncbi:MAG: DEAD/DEAH box helicase [Verrucomicrobiota bacterium]
MPAGTLWPEPLIQFNPSYERDLSVSDLVSDGILVSELGQIFEGFELYTHQVEALRLGAKRKSFVVTSGTGSGKSLTYLGSVFDYLLRGESMAGIKAVLVYPMNALNNSQIEELNKFRENYERNAGKPFPVSYEAYTGQTPREARDSIKQNPPDILLTNYMMLELLMTRRDERSLRTSIAQHLEFLMFDELHTYRGRQGADVGMLIRRIKASRGRAITCIGTSATMVSRGNAADKKRAVASVAEKVFGEPFDKEQIIVETLERSLNWTGFVPDESALRTAISVPVMTSLDAEPLLKHPTCVWLENRVALKLQGD